MWNLWQRNDGPPAAARGVTFPNNSRSYDATRCAVRFWGYYRSMENSFFVSNEALQRLQPDLNADEQGFLHAFDNHRDRIYSAATRVYAGGPRGSYDLTVRDF